ncbi:MAG: ABC transporter permease [Promethearchaeati archaeon SRVP18_Atabeyarchaeia-1]
MGRRRGLSTVYDISLVTRKEVRQLWRDKASLTLTFIIPVVILLAFGVTIPSSSSLAATNVPINTVVCDFDNTTLSHDFTAIIGNSTSLSLTFLQDASQARSGVEWGTYSAAIIIYQGFAANITRRPYPSNISVTLIVDDSKSYIVEIVQGQVANATQIFLDRIGFQYVSTFTLTQDKLSGRDLSFRSTAAAPVMGIALVFGCFDDAAGSMARERERGTFSRLLLTPINRLSIFMGKTISSMILTVVRTSLLLLVLFYYLNVSISGSLLLVFLIALLIDTTTVALGFAISSRAKNTRSVVIAQIAIMIPLIFLTGVLRPPEAMPDYARGLVNAIPYTYANDAFRRVVNLGQGIQFILGDMAVLLAATIILFAVAATMMKRSIV